MSREFDSIYNFLESLSYSTNIDFQILRKICTVLEVKNDVIPFEVHRLCCRLVINTSWSQLNFVATFYSKYLLHQPDRTLSMLLSEHNTFGYSLALIFQAGLNIGWKALSTNAGCQLNLPFDYYNCNPKKYAISLKSHLSATKLLSFWCHTFRFLETRPKLLDRQSCVSFTMILIEFLKNLMSYDLTAHNIIGLCTAYHLILEIGENKKISYTDQVLLIKGIMQWQYAVTCQAKTNSDNNKRDTSYINYSEKCFQTTLYLLQKLLVNASDSTELLALHDIVISNIRDQLKVLNPSQLNLPTYDDESFNQHNLNPKSTLISLNNMLLQFIIKITTLTSSRQDILDHDENNSGESNRFISLSITPLLDISTIHTIMTYYRNIIQNSADIQRDIIQWSSSSTVPGYQYSKHIAHDLFEFIRTSDTDNHRMTTEFPCRLLDAFNVMRSFECLVWSRAQQDNHCTTSALLNANGLSVVDNYLNLFRTKSHERSQRDGLLLICSMTRIMQPFQISLEHSITQPKVFEFILNSSDSSNGGRTGATLYEEMKSLTKDAIQTTCPTIVNQFIVLHNELFPMVSVEVSQSDESDRLSLSCYLLDHYLQSEGIDSQHPSGNTLIDFILQNKSSMERRMLVERFRRSHLFHWIRCACHHNLSNENESIVSDLPPSTIFPYLDAVFHTLPLPFQSSVITFICKSFPFPTPHIPSLINFISLYFKKLHTSWSSASPSDRMKKRTNHLASISVLTSIMTLIDSLQEKIIAVNDVEDDDSSNIHSLEEKIQQAQSKGIVIPDDLQRLLQVSSYQNKPVENCLMHQKFGQYQWKICIQYLTMKLKGNTSMGFDLVSPSWTAWITLVQMLGEYFETIVMPCDELISLHSQNDHTHVSEVTASVCAANATNLAMNTTAVYSDSYNDETPSEMSSLFFNDFFDDFDSKSPPSTSKPNEPSILPSLHEVGEGSLKPTKSKANEWGKVLTGKLQMMHLALLKQLQFSLSSIQVLLKSEQNLNLEKGLSSDQMNHKKIVIESDQIVERHLATIELTVARVIHIPNEENAIGIASPSHTALSSHSGRLQMAEMLAISLLSESFFALLGKSVNLKVINDPQDSDNKTSKIWLTVLEVYNQTLVDPLIESDESTENILGNIHLNQCLVVIQGSMMFIRNSFALFPKRSIEMLSALIVFWLKRSDKITQSKINEEMTHLHHLGCLSSLITTQTDFFITKILAPLFVADANLELKTVIIYQLLRSANANCINITFLQAYGAQLLYELLQWNVANTATMDHNQRAKIFNTALDMLKGYSVQIPTMYLLEDCPLLIYYLLQSDSIQRIDDQFLLTGKLYTTFNDFAAALKCKVHADHSSEFMSRHSFHTILIRFLWDLHPIEPSHPSYSKTWKSLRIYCTVCRQKSWILDLKFIQNVNEYLNHGTEMILADNFLYVMSNLIQNAWQDEYPLPTKTPLRQIQTLRCLQNIISILRPADLIKYLPKIMITIETSLNTSHNSTLITTIQLTKALCNRLSHESLQENLAAVVVSLYPLIEQRREVKLSHKLMNESNLDVTFMNTILMGKVWRSEEGNKMVYDTPSMIFLNDMIPEPVNPALSDEVHPIRLSNEVICFYLYLRSKPINLRLQNNIQQHSEELIQHLLTNASDDYLQTIPYIPNHIHSLQNIKQRHAKLYDSIPLDQWIRQLCHMIKAESVLIRQSALKKLLSLCRKKCFQLHSIVQKSSWRYKDNAIESETELDVVSYALLELMQLCARELNNEVKNLCAKCIGTIGAIDPTRLQISSKWLQRNSSGKLIKDCCQWIQNFMRSNYPDHPITLNDHAERSSMPQDSWRLTIVQLGMFLIEYHLVPGVKSSGILQDRSGYAIQQILQILAHSIDNQTQSSKSAADVTNVNSSSVGKKSKSNQPMPTILAEMLEERKILNITEPFYNTGYNITDKNPARTPPLFNEDLPFARWIGLWVRHLTTLSKGEYKGIFEACKGVVRTQSELSQFLLPHLIIDVLVQKDKTALADPVVGNKKRKNEQITTELDRQDSILIEICNVLQGGNTASDVNLDLQVLASNYSSLTIQQGNVQMCIQSIFMLLDTLHHWVHSSPSRSTVEVKNNPKYTPTATPQSTLRDQHVQKIAAFLETIPIELQINAAFRIKAYARALRYFETHRRELHRLRNSHQGKKIRKAGDDNLPYQDDIMVTIEQNKSIVDRANGTLPVLDSSELDNLITIFVNLEETDSVLGTQMLRHIFGYPHTSRNRILELEQMDDWMGVILEHSQLQSSWNYATSLSAQRMNRDQSNEMDIYTHPIKSVMYSTSDITDIERRRMRCLIELGHLEAVIDQTARMITTSPSISHALIPLGIEASWRLMRWDDLDTFLHQIDPSERANASSMDDLNQVKNNQVTCIPKYLPDLDRFQVALSKVMLNMKTLNEGELKDELSNLRVEIMHSLSAASLESYTRAYPFLVRLHILSEVEDGFQMLKTKSNPSMSIEQVNVTAPYSELQSRWANRLSLTSTSTSIRSLLLATRRVILGMCDENESVAQNYMELSETLRLEGKYELSRIAVRNAESIGLSQEAVLIQECKILKDAGQVNKALNLLEPVEINVLRIMNHLQSTNLTQSTEMGYDLTSEDVKKRLAQRLHLATQIMVESHTKHGKSILDRYQCVEMLNSNLEQAHYDHGRYLEYLFEDARKKETDLEYQLRFSTDGQLTTNSMNSMNHRGNSNHQKTTTTVALSATSQAFSMNDLDELIYRKSYEYFTQSIDQYAKCLGIGSKLVMQCVPRMLTMWFSFTSLSDNITLPIAREAASNSILRSTSRKNSNTNQVNVLTQQVNQLTSSIGIALKDVQNQANNRMYRAAKEIPVATWFTCTPQLISRTGHPNVTTLQVIEYILQEILTAYPKQAVWHMAGLMNSLNVERKTIGRKIMKTVYARLCSSNRMEDAMMLSQSQILFKSLVELATYATTKERKMKWTIQQDVQLQRFLVPNQSILRRGDGFQSELLYPDDENQLFIHKFHEIVEVASSKAKPKTLRIITTCGKTLKFLLKQEKDGDLRKDERLMEFNTIVNRLLQEDAEGRKRNLGLRTYSVICLHEECGILEWVNHTESIRSLISQSHQYWPDLYPAITYKDVYTEYTTFQNKFDDNIDQLLENYHELILSRYKPCFHKWFLQRFSDPTEWFESRICYTRSTAVWSAVGHIIGLGDRHTENILIDTTKGECVHVDFDCLFDKGLSLLKPEIIPFRLTPNMVDAMGPLGVEGPFRRTMEICLQVLRSHKETLLSVLEPFLRDPTVAWSRSGRAQRMAMMNTMITSEPMEGQPHSKTNPRSNSSGLGNSNGNKFIDHENKEATEMLHKIEERLMGVFNIYHPHRNKIIQGYKSRQELNKLPSIGLGACKEEALPLSVPGQVQKLIEEASAEENLVQLYIAISKNTTGQLVNFNLLTHGGIITLSSPISAGAPFDSNNPINFKILRKYSYKNEMNQINPNKIFIGNLPFNITNDQLGELFNDFGTIIGINIRKDRITNQPKGFAFITFEDSLSADEAVQKMHGSIAQGRPLTVNHAALRGTDNDNKSKEQSTTSKNIKSNPIHSKNSQKSLPSTKSPIGWGKWVGPKS